MTNHPLLSALKHTGNQILGKARSFCQPTCPVWERTFEIQNLGETSHVWWSRLPMERVFRVFGFSHIRDGLSVTYQYSPAWSMLDGHRTSPHVQALEFDFIDPTPLRILCPHIMNLRRSRQDCTMELNLGHGDNYAYFQVPKFQHHCSFVGKLAEMFTEQSSFKNPFVSYRSKFQKAVSCQWLAPSHFPSSVSDSVIVSITWYRLYGSPYLALIIWFNCKNDQGWQHGGCLCKSNSQGPSPHAFGRASSSTSLLFFSFYGFTASISRLVWFGFL